MSAVRLDTVDEKIITLLVDDARRSFADIGGRVGLTASAVEAPRGPAAGGRGDRRVHRPAGARGAGLDGRGLRRAVLPGQHAAAGDPGGVARFPEVVDASTISGEADALLRIVAADMQHFERVLEQIGAQAFVARTKSVLVLSALLRRPVTRCSRRPDLRRPRVAAVPRNEARRRS